MSIKGMTHAQSTEEQRVAIDRPGYSSTNHDDSQTRDDYVVGTGGADVLKQATVPITSRELCQKAYQSINVSKSMICAGYPEGGHDSCKTRIRTSWCCRQMRDSSVKTTSFHSAAHVLLSSHHWWRRRQWFCVKGRPNNGRLTDRPLCCKRR
ncbi:hypothetical protein TNCV_1113591 [Trichonephila clavipes]|nr:hypothetical protein TNCV_1113591 [Trichonephila clavipes]